MSPEDDARMLGQVLAAMETMTDTEKDRLVRFAEMVRQKQRTDEHRKRVRASLRLVVNNPSTVQS